MKKLFVLLFVGSILASCGGSGYTTDKEDVIAGYDDMKEDAQGHYDALLEIETSWAEDEKKCLKIMKISSLSFSKKLLKTMMQKEI